METAFQTAARQRFPGYRVEGDGEWALVCPIIKLVTLFDFAMLCKVEAEREHSNWRCQGHHKICRIKPAQRQSNWQPAGAAGYGRD
jgi:hypothetical protein